ncbi:Lrp/AsnC family transcriptional regulator [Spiractinospora alimapuensis]|uniref:Lrp/AsnC family transcriptional regulator n=1 Tax=Spiractinospora alimapuensis TaxID=2820884 RepID=UPI001F43CE9C|nr:Lrp/AsnC family transcriptional regulator [Spiractinospora alimapuensis]QVQ53502.1 Lrp/AsnC family transcriptional regulator [Spiractinospora alimapuensis]
MSGRSSGTPGVALRGGGDLDLVAALQVAPRASLRVIADALGVSVSTVSRRYQRLTEECGLKVLGQVSWSALSETHPQHVWITTVPGTADRVAEDIAELPEARFVAVTTGEADVFCILHPERRDQLSDLLRVRLPSVGGIVATRAEIGLAAHRTGAQWRLERLSPSQLEALRAEVPPAGGKPDGASGLTTDELGVARVLGRDGRASAADVAREVGTSPSTAYRLIRALLTRRVVVPRVDIEPTLLGYPLEVVVSLTAVPGQAEELATTLARHPSARYVATVGGRASVLFHGLFTHETALAQFLTHDLGALPGVSASDLSVILRVVTRYWARGRTS